MWKRILKILQNKYLIAFLTFGVWMIFFDRNNLVQRHKLKQDLMELQREKEYYQSEIENDSIALYNLLSDTENLIRFGREKYLMKKDSEVIFLVIPKEEK